MPDDEDIEKRTAAVLKVVEIFRLERMAYLTFTIIAFLVLLGFMIAILVKKGGDTDPTPLTMLFGSTSLTGFAANRFLTVFYRAVDMVSRQG